MSALSLNSFECVLMLHVARPYCRRILANPAKKGEIEMEIEMRKGGGKGMEEMEVRRGEKKRRRGGEGTEGRGGDGGERR